MQLVVDLGLIDAETQSPPAAARWANPYQLVAAKLMPLRNGKAGTEFADARWPRPVIHNISLRNELRSFWAVASASSRDELLGIEKLPKSRPNAILRAPDRVAFCRRLRCSIDTAMS